MPISVVCNGCQKRLKAPDSAAGKRTKCPACQTVIQIPAAGASTGKESWTVKTGTGDSYGPVTKSELDQWVKEGRLDDECQVLKEGAPQWQWASDVYPELAAASQPGQPAASDPFGQAANLPGQTPANPSPLGQASQPMGFPQQGQFGQAAAFPSQSFPAQPYSTPTQPSFASSNPYASGSVAGRAQARAGDASAGIITIAVINFVLSAINLFCGIAATVAAIGGAALFGSIGGEGAAAGKAIGGIWFVLFIIVAILYFVMGVLLLMGGIGLLKRANWGRVLTLICAGLAGVGALFQVFGIINGNFSSIVGFLLYAGYCVAAFVVLLSKGANRAFSQGRR